MNCEKNFLDLSSRIVAFVVMKRVHVSDMFTIYVKKYLDEVIERTMPIIKNSYPSLRQRVNIAIVRVVRKIFGFFFSFICISFKGGESRRK